MTEDQRGEEAGGARETHGSSLCNRVKTEGRNVRRALFGALTGVGVKCRGKARELSCYVFGQCVEQVEWMRDVRCTESPVVYLPIGEQENG